MLCIYVVVCVADLMLSNFCDSMNEHINKTSPFLYSTNLARLLLLFFPDLEKSTAIPDQQNPFYQRKITWQLTCTQTKQSALKGSLPNMKLSQNVKNVSLLV